ncbi:MAG: hypothetical protein HC830_14925 [Bacteroidetes bacterium]|nr:hypothetical protein [Bacteroidales bacterium]NJO70395.1 hypothetical protein [Bacteroidota bacterium]
MDNPSNILRPALPEPNFEVPVYEKAEEEKGLLALARQYVRRNFQEQEEAELPEKPEKRITLWDVADITLKGYNQISENDIRLHKETDENGKIVTLAIETEGGKFGFGNKN